MYVIVCPQTSVSSWKKIDSFAEHNTRLRPNTLFLSVARKSVSGGCASSVWSNYVDPLRKPLPPLRPCSIASIVTARCAHAGGGQQQHEDEQKFTKSLRYYDPHIPHPSSSALNKMLRICLHYTRTPYGSFCSVKYNTRSPLRTNGSIAGTRKSNVKHLILRIRLWQSFFSVTLRVLFWAIWATVGLPGHFEPFRPRWDSWSTLGHLSHSVLFGSALFGSREIWATWAKLSKFVIHSQSKNCCFNNFLIFGKQIVPQSARICALGGVKSQFGQCPNIHVFFGRDFPKKLAKSTLLHCFACFPHSSIRSYSPLGTGAGALWPPEPR